MPGFLARPRSMLIMVQQISMSADLAMAGQTTASTVVVVLHNHRLT